MSYTNEKSDSSPKRCYVGGRGGHAPGHVRNAFLKAHRIVHAPGSTTKFEEALGPDACDWFTSQRQAQWQRITPAQRAAWLLGQLWDCTDILPGDVCQELDLPCGSSYAQGVRKLQRNHGGGRTPQNKTHRLPRQ